MAEPLDLDAIEARAHAATPGPWMVHLAPTGIRGSVPYAFIHRVGPAGPPIAERHNGGTVADAEFIAHARADVPTLLAIARAAVAIAVHLRRLEPNLLHDEERALLALLDRHTAGGQAAVPPWEDREECRADLIDPAGPAVA